MPPRSLSDLIRLPLSVRLNVQLMTVMFETPPDVKLPMETPCPSPKVQFVMTMSAEADALLPTATLSSPTLILQLRITAFVSAKSIASVLCEGLVGSDEDGALILTPSIVTFPARPLMTRCATGELEKVASRIHTRLQAEKLTIAGRLFVLYPGHHGEPCPSIAPLPLISISCRLDPLMKFAGETMPPGYWS